MIRHVVAYLGSVLLETSDEHITRRRAIEGRHRHVHPGNHVSDPRD